MIETDAKEEAAPEATRTVASIRIDIARKTPFIRHAGGSQRQGSHRTP
jgi:hypothetical protein